MPNWCSNQLTLRHEDPAMIQRAYDAFNRGELLQEFIPCPAELIDTVSGFVPEQEALEAKQAANRAKYGYSTWYEHNINEWGTKWDVGGDGCDAIIDLIELSVTFESAWAPPIAAYERLEELGFEVRATYYEPGMAFCGVSEDGSDDYYEYGGMSADEIEDTLPSDLDEEYGISQAVSEWEQEQEEENIDIDLDGGLSATNE